MGGTANNRLSGLVPGGFRPAVVVFGQLR